MGSDFERRQYARPPVREALCSATFDRIPWSIASPGRLFEKVASDYPVEPQQQHAGNFSFSPDAVSFGQEDRYLYRDDSGRLLIASSSQLSANAIVDNFEYEGWDSLRDRFVRSFSQFLGLFGPEILIRRLSVRYINFIAIEESEFDINRYFAIPVPRVEQALHLRGFLIRTESRLVEPDSGLILTFTTAEPQDAQSSGFMLDLEVYQDFPEGLSGASEEMVGILESLHDIENSEFERLITDETRGLFA